MLSLLKRCPYRSPKGETEKFSLFVADPIPQQGPGLLGRALCLNSPKMDTVRQPPYSKRCKLVIGFDINY